MLHEDSEHLCSNQSREFPLDFCIEMNQRIRWPWPKLLTRTEAPFKVPCVPWSSLFFMLRVETVKQAILLFYGRASHGKSQGSRLKSPVNQTLAHLPCSLKCVEVRRAHACRTQHLLRLLLQKRCNKSTMEFNGWCEALISIANASWKKEGERLDGGLIKKWHCS